MVVDMTCSNSQILFPELSRNSILAGPPQPSSYVKQLLKSIKTRSTSTPIHSIEFGNLMVSFTTSLTSGSQTGMTASGQSVQKESQNTLSRPTRGILIIGYLSTTFSRTTPFIGPTGRDLPSTHRMEELAQRASGKPVEKTDDIWGLLAQGAVSEEEVLTAYQENLEVALPHVATLISEIGGKTVVTSDHGNLYGERPFPFRSKIYAHPFGIHAKHLIEIPWLVTPAHSRRKTTEGKGGSSQPGLCQRRSRGPTRKVRLC